jgi:thioredoxin-dependent peroxiredoxin
MAEIIIRGNTFHTNGELPRLGSEAPHFKLTKGDLSTVTNEDLKGKNVVLNIFPSIDTPTCATSVRKFNEQASTLSETVVLCVSKDLPFAMSRFCGAEGLQNVVTASDFRNEGFESGYGLRIEDGPLYGLLARAVVVIDKEGKVSHTELVANISDEPNYDKALAVLK